MIKVNEFTITEKDFDMACAEKKYYTRKEQLDKNDVDDIVSQLVEATLLMEEAEKAKIEVTDPEIDQMLAQISSNFETKEAFEAALEKTGETLETTKFKIKKNIVLQKYIQLNYIDKTEVSDDDTLKYYEANKTKFISGEEVRASHILFKKDDKELALEVHEKLLAGDDFAEFASAHSECPSREKGGDLGSFGRGKMVAEFDKAAFELQKDEISDLVETQFGYHIIKVTEKNIGGMKKFEEVKDVLKENMRNTVVNNNISKFAQELKSKAKIEIDEKLVEKRIA
ncbi:MAG: peptidylprolyl isomerase [Candidatus Delongbacteria bacterium]|nr:peptidylprolyl isomerase [Candidatus Delongbacteria bacterium]